MANITLFAQATNKLPKESIRKIIRDPKTDFGQQAVWQRSKFRFRMPIKLLDSSTITLTMPLYEWAHYTTKKGAVKMHTLLDYDSLLPEFVNITNGGSPILSYRSD